MKIITDEKGSIVAAAPHNSSPKDTKVNIALSPLHNQKSHIVDLPAEVAKITPGNRFHSMINHLLDFSDPNQVKVKQLDFKKTKH